MYSRKPFNNPIINIKIILILVLVYIWLNFYINHDSTEYLKYMCRVLCFCQLRITFSQVVFQERTDVNGFSILALYVAEAWSLRALIRARQVAIGFHPLDLGIRYLVRFTLLPRISKNTCSIGNNKHNYIVRIVFFV